MGEAVYTVNRVKAILLDPEYLIIATTRQRLLEAIEAAEHRGQSTITLPEPINPQRTTQLKLTD